MFYKRNIYSNILFYYFVFVVKYIGIIKCAIVTILGTPFGGVNYVHNVGHCHHIRVPNFLINPTKIFLPIM